MNKPKISVILPCYHVAQYLAGIFQDLKAQTFKDFEMLFVNDGDEKLSPMLADLARQDSRVTVIEKKNGGGEFRP